MAVQYIILCKENGARIVGSKMIPVWFGWIYMCFNHSKDEKEPETRFCLKFDLTGKWANDHYFFSFWLVDRYVEYPKL